MAKPPRLSIVRLTMPALLAAAIFSSVTLAEEPVRVELRSGRSYTGQIDARTNDDRLWLRFGQAGAYLLRPVDWGQISRAEHSGKELTPQELRELVPEIATPAPLPPPVEPAPRDQSLSPDEPSRPPEPVRLVSVQFEAYLANWDGDVEADGLIVRLMPLANDGQLAPVGGTLDVDLVTIRRRDFNQVPDGRGRTFDSIGRWNKAVSPADIGPAGAVLRLPFQAVHPEFDTTVAPYGLVHVRYSAAGHGVFEASQDVVRIRPFAPLRDARQQSGQSRFLNLELRGR